MPTFLRLITIMAMFGLVAACADTGEKKAMSAGGGAFEMGKDMAAGQKRLTNARARGAADKSPKHAAAAQKQFDCWIRQAQAKQKKKAAACKSSFYGAMALLESDVFAPPKRKKATKRGPPRTQHFLVFFGLDSAKISAGEAKAIAAAAKFAKSNKGSNVYVTGHTDQSGSKKYNMALAKMRTDAVVKGLTGMGIKKRAVGAVVQGENDPAVSRAGKKDGRNRRVVISVIY